MNRKLETKRLFIYLALTFGLTWIIFFAFILTGHKWDGSNPRLESLTALGMLVPMLSHVFTRWITKEGFALTGKKSMMLRISLKNKKWVFYLFAMLIPWVYYEVWHALIFLVSPGTFDPEYYKVIGMDRKLVWLVPLNGIVTCSIVSFAALGEEGGWRGYMMPKLISLLGTGKAVLTGGIIWGLWYAPLTCVGYNFGTEYPGFPYFGIVVMCVNCILMGIMLTYVTVKSGSVWPAVIMNAVNNVSPSILAFFTNTEKASQILTNPFYSYLLCLIPMAVTAGLSPVLLCRAKPSEQSRKYE